MALISAASATSAQTIDENWQRCSSDDIDTDNDGIIASCTALIDSGQGDARTRSAEYTFRALAYEYRYRKDGPQNDKALADYQAGVQLDPGNGAARLGLDALSQPDN
jgi:hypothetical protein